MHTVRAFDAEAKIAELLDKVAAGETVLITRRGEAAALLIPPTKFIRTGPRRSARSSVFASHAKPEK